MNETSTNLKDSPSVSVVIAAFSMDRWSDLREAVASVLAQRLQVLETIVVIDHNPELMAKAASELPPVTVIANTGSRGASGARNTGAAASRAEVLVFLDDDAVASSGWLKALLQPFKDPAVVGVGGRLEPIWKTYQTALVPSGVRLDGRLLLPRNA